MKKSIIKKTLYNNTKIVATLGPISYSKKMINSLIDAGVDIFRLNFSHGDYKTFDKYIKNIQCINKKLNVHIPIFQDLQGPKIRVGRIVNDAVEIKKNSVIQIVPHALVGNEKKISITYNNLYRNIKVNEKILLDDGTIELKVIKIKDKIIYCKILNSAILKCGKGVNLPHSKLKLPALTKKDKQDIQYALKHDIHIFALSFVQERRDIILLKNCLNKYTKEPFTIIAKIEKPQAVENIQSIIKEVDAIMIARGDLGVEMSPEKIPLIQKKFIQIANQNNKFVITATQMLESMINNPIPTRAETTDVFNAVVDRTDAVMLSGETAVGKNSIKTVKIMTKILKNAESYLKQEVSMVKKKESNGSRSLISRSMYDMSKSLQSEYLISFTKSGTSTKILSKIKPDSKILAFTPDRKILDELFFYYGVFPFYLEKLLDTDVMLEKTKQFLLINKLVKKGDTVIISLGIPIPDLPETNTVIIYHIT